MKYGFGWVWVATISTISATISLGHMSAIYVPSDVEIDTVAR